MSSREIRVRLASIGDTDFVVGSEATNLGRDAWSGSLVAAGIANQVPTVNYLVAELGAHPVGHAVVSLAGDIAELQRIAVNLAARQAGVGQALLAGVIGYARNGGAERVLLEVRADNDPAMRFYLAAGFTEIDRRPRYYKDGAAAVVMVLDLDRAN